MRIFTCRELVKAGRNLCAMTYSDVHCSVLRSVLQGVAGCCRVLQGVAGCCRVLQGVARRCRVSQCVVVYYPCAGMHHRRHAPPVLAIRRVAECYRVLRCVAERCRVLYVWRCRALQSVAGCCRVLQGVAIGSPRAGLRRVNLPSGDLQGVAQ